jgi:hypothetical protein
VSPKTMTRRRTVLIAVSLLVVAALLGWFLGSRADDPKSEADPSAAESSTTASPTPDPAPSSGPTGTPSPGSLEEVPVGEVTTEPAVPLTATADFGTGMTLRILRIESVQGEARGPGEIAGPAVRLTLKMSNSSDAAVSLEGAVVDVSTGADHTPAPGLTGPGGREFEGELPAGGSATAAYVFAVPEGDRDRLRVAVSYVAAAPVVVFAGPAQ